VHPRPDRISPTVRQAGGGYTTHEERVMGILDNLFGFSGPPIDDKPGQPIMLVVFADDQSVSASPITLRHAMTLAGKLLHALGARVDWDALGENEAAREIGTTRSVMQ
jgi:hypothetical protein